MARVQLQLPDTFSFVTSIAVRITDVNYGGHVGNDAILSLMHEARALFLKQYGYTELDAAGVSLIMADAIIQYKSELFYGDTLRIYVAAFDFSRAGFDLGYKLVKGKEETVVALAKTGMVCFDYKARKVVAVPGSLNRDLGGFKD